MVLFVAVMIAKRCMSSIIPTVMIANTLLCMTIAALGIAKKDAGRRFEKAVSGKFW